MNTKLKSILLLSALSVSALNVFAQNLVVTSNTTVTGAHYENNGNNYAALTNTAAWTFTGTNITLTGTGASGNGRIGANFTGGGQLNLTDSDITATLYGIQLTNTSAATLRDTVIRSYSHGISLSGTAVLELYHADIITQNGYGLYLTASATATVIGGTITTGGANQHGVYASNSTVDLQDLAVTTAGNSAYGLYLTTSTVTVTGGAITTTSTSAYGISAATASRVTLQDGTVIRSYSHGINLTGASVLELYHADITTQNGNGLNLTASATATVTGGTITTTSGGSGISAVAASRVTLQDGTVIRSYAHGINLSSTSVLEPYYADIITQNGNGLNLTTSSTATVTGGTIATTLSGIGVRVDVASTVDLKNLTITTGTTNTAYGIYLTNTSAATLDNTTITTTAAHGLNLATSSTATVTGGTITTTLSGNGINAATASRVTLRGNTVIRSYNNGISLSGTSVLDPYYADIITQNGVGLYLAISSTATITGGTITTTSGGAGINAASASTVQLADGVAIRSYGDGINLSGTSVLAAPWHADIITQNGNGLSLNLSATAVITGGTITVAGVSGANRNGLVVGNYGPNHLLVENTLIDSIGGGLSIGTPAAVLNNVTIRSRDGAGINTYYSGTFTMTGGSITHTGDGYAGVYANERGHGSLIDVAILTTGNAPGLRIQNRSGLDLTGGSITTTGDRGVGVRLLALPDNTLTLDRVAVTTAGADAPALWMDATYADGGTNTVTITGGTLASARHAAIGVNVQKVNPADPDPAASAIIAGGVGTVYDVRITDGATVSGAKLLEVASIYSGTDAAGDLVEVLDKHTVLNLTADGGVTLAGDVNIKDTADVTLTLSDRATLSGDLTASGTAATLDLTVSGPGSALLGDIAQRDQAAVTVTLSDHATGAGGFDGGTLIIGGDSAWDFTKATTTDRIDNHGVIRLGAPGNYLALRSDSISGNGTWYFPIDSDTGAKSTVTGSTHIDSHPRGIISATGDGLRDPNAVANTLVTGINKENWIWDNFSWGLDEYTQDGHDAAGNPHFTRHGVSPIGTTLGSAIAIQQSMWFAQQDSLLKRMGELRLAPPMSPASPESPASPLIDNLWLRSYGQQLNLSGQVAGQAYQQLIYGVDVGTDHKFTLNADNDLYLGIYAGYGRSDIDYRTPGADGEINSYYGGLYATWLHRSGFYLDATIKAASVDNNLKAPYGYTQLTANYNDVNIGGSLELGKKFTFADDWFIEPQFQVNYLHILAENYTAGPMTLTASDLDALQLRLGSVFGRTLKLANGGALQPYVKISGVETISSGGTLRNGYQSTRANTDGARAELGAGLIWQLDTHNQLHLDYEASFGDKYDKPWGLTAGYRHQF